MSAWIEIGYVETQNCNVTVALLVSAWIEMPVVPMVAICWPRRTPRECVD